MNDSEKWIWLAVGLAAGILHASMLWHAAHRLSVWSSLWGMLRLFAVAAVLVTAAVWGSILAAAAGWAVGLVSIGTWLVIRGPAPRPSSPQVESQE
jgi:hypothetical protein